MKDKILNCLTKYGVKKGTILYRGGGRNSRSNVVQSWTMSKEFAKKYGNVQIMKLVKNEKTIDVVKVFKTKGFPYFGHIVSIDEVIKAREVLIVKF